MNFSDLGLPIPVGSVSSTSNSDGTLTISPATGAVVASLNISNTNGWTGQQYFSAAALTFSSTISWNLNIAQAATLVATSNTNFTLSNPTNMNNGGTYTLIITQYSTGGQVITWGSAYKFASGIAFVLSTGNSQIDIVTFLSDGTNMYATGLNNFS